VLATKYLRAELSGHFGTSAEVSSGHLAAIVPKCVGLVPKCLGSEASGRDQA